MANESAWSENEITADTSQAVLQQAFAVSAMTEVAH